jgi:hypothetical protein
LGCVITQVVAAGYHVHMKRCALVLLLFVVGACGPEVVTDITWACIVPADNECSNASWPGAIELAGGCRGVYPADRPYQVVVQMPNLTGPYSDEECKVEIVGDRALRVSANYLSYRDRDEVAYREWLEASCMTPILESGDWTIEFEDGNPGGFRVADDGVEQYMACGVSK